MFIHSEGDFEVLRQLVFSCDLTTVFLTAALHIHKYACNGRSTSLLEYGNCIARNLILTCRHVLHDGVHLTVTQLVGIYVVCRTPSLDEVTDGNLTVLVAVALITACAGRTYIDSPSVSITGLEVRVCHK